jgi:hypothetical protein
MAAEQKETAGDASAPTPDSQKAVADKPTAKQGEGEPGSGSLNLPAFRPGICSTAGPVAGQILKKSAALVAVPSFGQARSFWSF